MASRVAQDFVEGLSSRRGKTVVLKGLNAVVANVLLCLIVLKSINMVIIFPVPYKHAYMVPRYIACTCIIYQTINHDDHRAQTKVPRRCSLSI